MNEPAKQMGPAACSLTALGMLNALGNSPAEIWPRLIAGDGSRFTQRSDLIQNEERPFGAVLGELPSIPQRLSRFDCRNNQLSLAAFELIATEVENAIARYGADRVGIVVGSSTAGSAEAESAVRRACEGGGVLPARFDLIQLEYAGESEFLARISGAAGPSYALSTACSTGAKALASARGLIDLGFCDAVIAGAADTLCQLTANGFHSLQAVSQGVTNPMSRNRDGITLGEGAALFLVERGEGEIQLLGAGESSDAHHISAPQPEGVGAERAMRGALIDAGLDPAEIDYLNLHGTGTPHNDSMESLAVDRVFAPSPPCSSTKSLVGHTLGASGALEAGFCWLVLDHLCEGELRLPPHCFDAEPDTALPALDLVEVGRLTRVGEEARVMTNSFGFGGSNCSLVLGRGQA